MNRASTRIRLLAAIVILGAGCQHMPYDAFDLQQQADTARRLFQPIHDGQVSMLKALHAVNAQPVVFALSPRGVKALPEPQPAHTWWNEDRLVFFNLPQEGDAQRPAWTYLSPRTLNLVPLQQPLPPDSDILALDPATYAVYRSLPNLKAVSRDLDIIQFTFSIDELGQIKFKKPSPIIIEKGADVFPIILAKDNTLIYVHQENENHHRLMIGNIHNSAPAPIWTDQTFDVGIPWLLPDGNLAVSANPEGVYRIYRLDLTNPDSPELLPMSFDKYRQKRHTEYVIAPLSHEGRLEPRLLKIPTSIDLDTLTNLVIAHNAGINEKRAALASALVQEGMARLANWPILNFGLDFERDASIFSKRPQLFVGDVFSIGVLRGTLGLFQPLLDIKRNRALTKRGHWRAEMAKDLLADEINESLAEAASLYFEAQYLIRLTRLEEKWIAVAQERRRYYDTLTEKGDALRIQRLAAQNIIEGLQSEHTFQTERLRILESRIKRIAGLADHLHIEIEEAAFDLHKFPLSIIDEVREATLLNHPLIQFVQHQLSEAFYLRAAGANIRPALNFAASFTVLERQFDRREDLSTTVGGVPLRTVNRTRDQQTRETAVASVAGQYPIASRRASRLHQAQWDNLIHALELEKEAAADDAVSTVEQAYVAFLASQNDYKAKRASVMFTLEQLRLARLLRDYGPAGTIIEVPRVQRDSTGAIPRFSVPRLTRDFSVESTVITPDPLAHLTAQFAYLAATANIYKVEMDLAIRMAVLWREMGLATKLSETARPWNTHLRSRYRPALWLWRSKEVIGDDKDAERFIDTARTLDLRRTYLYLHSDSELIGERFWRERLTYFINLCQRHHIEVWALLGEPEWLTADGTAPMTRALRRIMEFNDARGPLEPKLAGVKLDLEPHSLPDWQRSPDAQRRLARKYTTLIKNAHNILQGTIPLWADVPVAFFRPEHAAILEALEENLDGLTVMTYFNNEKPIRDYADLAMARYSKPLEFGLEFSPKAPATDTLAQWPRERTDDLVNALTKSFAGQTNFVGLAFHDYYGVRDYYETGSTP